MEDRDEVRVDLDGDDMAGRLSECLGHRADAWSDLKDTVVLRDFRASDDVLEHVFVDQEVLTEALLEAEIVLLYDFDGFLWVD